MALVSQFLDGGAIINSISRGMSDQMALNKSLRELMLLDQRIGNNYRQSKYGTFDPGNPTPSTPATSSDPYSGLPDPTTIKGDRLPSSQLGPTVDGAQYTTGQNERGPNNGLGPGQRDLLPEDKIKTRLSQDQGNNQSLIGPVRQDAPNSRVNIFGPAQTPAVQPLRPAEAATMRTPAKDISRIPQDVVAQPQQTPQQTPHDSVRGDAITQRLNTVPQDVVAQPQKPKTYAPPTELLQQNVDPNLLGVHKGLYDITGADLKVNSSYRSTRENDEVGGAKHSQHLTGKAMDLNTASLSVDQRRSVLAKLYDDPRVGGIGLYPSGNIHVDVRPRGADGTIAIWGDGGSYKADPKTITEIGSLPPDKRAALYTGPAQERATAQRDAQVAENFSRPQSYTRSLLASKIVESANALGANPRDLATLISYETGGTFDAGKRGPVTQYGQHRGLIQFGEPQAKKYGVNFDDAINSQLGKDGAVVKYLKDNGYKPGMDIYQMYSIINTGAPNRLNASDAKNGGAPGTVYEKVRYQMSDHAANADALLGGKGGGNVVNVDNSKSPRVYGVGFNGAPNQVADIQQSNAYANSIQGYIQSSIASAIANLMGGQQNDPQNMQVNRFRYTPPAQNAAPAPTPQPLGDLPQEQSPGALQAILQRLLSLANQPANVTIDPNAGIE